MNEDELATGAALAAAGAAAAAAARIPHAPVRAAVTAAVTAVTVAVYVWWNARQRQAAVVEAYAMGARHGASYARPHRKPPQPVPRAASEPVRLAIPLPGVPPRV